MTSIYLGVVTVIFSSFQKLQLLSRPFACGVFEDASPFFKLFPCGLPHCILAVLWPGNPRCTFKLEDLQLSLVRIMVAPARSFGIEATREDFVRRRWYSAPHRAAPRGSLLYGLLIRSGIELGRHDGPSGITIVWYTMLLYSTSLDLFAQTSFVPRATSLFVILPGRPPSSTPSSPESSRFYSYFGPGEIALVPN
jgi:hypothetical protein